jgi:2-polyprenyl-3-methyl-5-hydroxy-6-metoxy-1,4-benzoquinol methylase
MCSLHEDASGNIESLLRSLASTHRKILDFGCGVGGYLHFLSKNFDEVTAADTSRACVEQAGAVARLLTNVEVLPVRALRRSGAGRYDAVLMANVLLSPDPAERQSILREAIGHLQPGGDLVLVVPAIESVHLAEAVRRRHLPRRRTVYSTPMPGRYEPGVVCIHGQPTKHHAAEELAYELQQEGLAIIDLARAEYTWASEGFDELDDVVRQRPWDWLVRARLTAAEGRPRRRSGKAQTAKA